MSSDRRFPPVPHAALATVLAGALLALVACGKQGDPAPRPRAVPQAAGDLTVRQRGLELLFDVGYPKATVAGLPLEGLASATLYEIVVPALVDHKIPSLGPNDLEGQAKPVLELSGTALAEAVVGDRLRFRIPIPESALVKPLPPKPPAPPPGAATPGAPGAATAAPGATTPATATPPASPAPTPPASTPPAATPAPAPAAPSATSATPPATTAPTPAAPGVSAAATPAAPDTPPAQARMYAFRTKEVRGLDSPWSNVVGIVPLITPASPADLTVTAQKGGVSLTWTPSEGATGYAVLRREATEKEWAAPLTGLPMSARSFVDTSARYGTRYVYTVLAVVASALPVESAPTSAREIDYRDVFPPEPPTELRALFVGGQVRLVWDASADADLAGYRIERASGGGKFAALPGELATGTAGSDPAPPAGSSLRYRLVAVDRAGNAAPPTEPVAIDVP